MRFQDRVIELTRQAGEDLFRTARAVPPDRLTWRPLEMGRSVLDILQECAQQPAFLPRLLTPASPPLSPEMRAALREERAQWTTIDACEEAYRRNLEAAVQAIREVPDERLDEVVSLPFRPGVTRTIAQILLTVYWQLVYHTGQVNYIQTLYGDREMH
jgi:uncharacterized damage-inducible protein DinB